MGRLALKNPNDEGVRPMSWQLTTPIDAGEVDPDAPGGQFTHAVVEPFEHSARIRRIGGFTTYGWTVDNVFVPTTVVVSRPFQLIGADYIAAVSQVSDGINTWYNGVANYLYETLAARPAGHPDGWLPPGVRV